MGAKRPWWVAATGLALALALVSGCTAAKNTGAGEPSSPAQTSSATTSTPTSPGPAPLAVLTLQPGNGAQSVNPAVPISASVQFGTITSARLVNIATNRVVKGALDASATAWTSAEDLGYGNTYTLSVQARNAEGTAVAQTSTFTTVQPNNLTMPYLQTVYNQGLVNGGTYGVGMIINIHFDEPITDRAAAEKAISVTSTPTTVGAFYWLSNQVVHWRPKVYWTPGTVVTVKANVYGANLGGGLYGQQDKSTTFKIGDSHIAIADDRTHQVKVYVNGTVVRTMPTSMGRHTSIPGEHGPVSLYTPEGTYTVMDHNESVIMDSSTFGIPKGNPNYYREEILWATRISHDGIFLHELMSTVWAQGREDVSHGCLNLNHDNAYWYFHHSYIGDVVKVINVGGPKLTLANGGDWDVPWAQWVKGGVNQA